MGKSRKKSSGNLIAHIVRLKAGKFFDVKASDKANARENTKAYMRTYMESSTEEKKILRIELNKDLKRYALRCSPVPV